ncbi:hypothetical protein H072_1145 [Dactylellina haptotyla CBS 200.50]|uniref:Uncharacterized protein n=1 Tax=Dactylellina haptotyla (strain CBS 200.50) TaxID=1284197 RepID=S8AV84_DACHA|nr:hypothetical protein H072_1145 [Dactylellina haptotyla CBS 200.50]
MNTPLPAPVHLIQNVHYLPTGSKIRVLGCRSSNAIPPPFDRNTDTTAARTAEEQKKEERLPNHIPPPPPPPPPPLPSINGKGKAASSKATRISVAYTTAPAQVDMEKTYTLSVSIDLLLQSAKENLEKSMPPIDEGVWVNVTGYKQADGVLQAIVMAKVKGKLDLKAYEKAVVGMCAVREEAEKKVFEGSAMGSAVDGGQWAP